jgi:hypothetical protein
MRPTHALDWDACHVRGLAWLRGGRFTNRNTTRNRALPSLPHNCCFRISFERMATGERWYARQRNVIRSFGKMISG